MHKGLRSHRAVAVLLTLCLGALGHSRAAAQVCAVPGADGPASVAGGVVNTYFPAVASAAAGATSIVLGTAQGTTPIAPGDLLLVIQMQDATIDSTDGGAYGDGTAGEPAAGATSLGNAGRYEYAVAATSVGLGGGTVTLRQPLTNAYAQAPATLLQGRRTFQVVRVPQYSSLSVTGLITSLAWDGNSGGIVALDVAGQMTFSGAGGISVFGQGFRGGGATARSFAGGDGTTIPFPSVSTLASLQNGAKGEGIAGTPQLVNVDPNPASLDPGTIVNLGVQGYPAGDFSRGAPGTAGGGGADAGLGGAVIANRHNNGGGGGGANAGAGGRGGIGFALNTANWATHLGGFGGAAFSAASAARVVLGGGGGAGDVNDGPAPPPSVPTVSTDYGSGAAGGGIVMVRAGTIAGTGTINANGASAPVMAALDAAGGGGAGGSVIVVTQSGTVGGLTVTARGGNGGESRIVGPAHGPGGGGGGGFALLSGAVADVSGGLSGIGAAGFGGSPAHGATAGAAGVSLPITAAGDSPTAAAGARCLAALTATKTTSTPTRALGVDTTATYTVSVQNPAGGGTAYGVAIEDDLPAPFTYGGAAVTPVYAPAACGTGPASVAGAGADPVTFGAAGGGAAAAFTIPGGCTVSLTFDVNLNAAALGTYQNPAVFRFADPTRTIGGTAAAGGNPVVAPGGTFASGAPVGGSNYVAASATTEDVTIAPASADLSLTKTAAPAAAIIGQNLTFTITVANAGPNAATGVVVRDVLPPGYTFVSAAPGAGTFDPLTGLWSGLALASGASASLAIVATVNPTGPYANTAEVFASGVSDPDSTPNNGVAGEDDIATSTPTVTGTGFTALVFNDANGNGTQDGGEGGLANVQILVTDSTATVRTITTNAGGTATASLPPGATTIDIVESTLPAGAALTAGTDPRTIAIVAGTPAATVTGYQVRGTVAGRVFRDSNGNGVLDAGEPAVGNLPVVITTAAAQTVNVSTDAAGSFQQVVPAGATGVRVNDLSGFIITTANNPQTVAVTGGAVVSATPVGFAPFASVNGAVWRDLDSDRVRDAGEPGLAGWRIDLLNPATGAIVLSATTSASGQYSVPNVVPATTYRVRYTAPNGVVWGVGVNGETNNPQSNSVLNAAQRSLDITPQPGETLVQQSLPVDPQGIAYDTLTRQALAGARIAITGPAGFTPATHLLGGAANSTQTTAADGFYQFLLLPGAPSGTYTLVLTPPTSYTAPSTFLPPAGTLDPTGLGSNGVFRVQGQSGPPTGAQPTTYYLAFSLAAGDPDVVNNHVPFDPASLSGGAIRLTKRADRASAVVGGLVAYTITLENTSNTSLPGLEVRDVTPAGFTYVEASARLDGSATALTVRGPRPLVFTPIDLAPGQRRTLRYVLRVGAGTVRGEYPNTATPFALGRAVGAPDTARVSVVADPTFEDATVLGKVFDDQDGDGWQDEDEPGIPGVRLATVEGLISETDAFGRYHFAAVDGGFMERGRNFIVKLDLSSLPAGTEVTTENPRVARLTPGMPSRFDFGVRLKELPLPSKRIDLKLADVYFVDGSAEVLPQYLPLLKEVADRVARGEPATITIRVVPPRPDGCSSECQLGRRRIDAVRRVLTRLLGPEGIRNVEIVADYTAAGGVASRGPLAEGLRRVAWALLTSLVPAAHAQAAVAACRGATCATQPVEVRARYPRALDEGFGRFWATEDASAVEPRLAIEGPDRLPVRGGAIVASADFAIYTNYSMFVDRYEVVVYRSGDADRVRPLATVPVAFLGGSLRNLLTARWDARGTRVPRDESLVYVARAISRDGRVDTTVERRLQLVTSAEYDEQASLVAAASRALGEPDGGEGAATDVDSTPLKGRFVVLQPGASTGGQQLRIAPRLPSPGTQLPDEDRAQLEGRGGAKLTLVDPVARTGVDAAGGLALAESASAAGVPLGQIGLEDSLPPQFTRKALLADLATIDDDRLQVLYGRNDLARRAIPVHGSRVRVAGSGVSGSAIVRLNGQVVPVDQDGSLAYESIMPIGKHDLFLDVVPVAGDVWPMPLSVDVTGRHLFMVGLVDLTWQKNDLSGSIEPLSADDRYLEDTLGEGRVAMYLKGKIRGKYLLTTQLDTTEEQLGDIVDDFSSKDPRRLFRNIDPDRYYPVYGDDSTTVQDADTQGRLYARLDWDKSRALWGNFNTNFTGTEFAQYNRTLYGANLAWNTLDSTSHGESRTQVNAFASEAQTAVGHDEFLGTGGSLYYLRYTDVVEGSAKARIEILDRVTERTLEQLALVEGVDYEIDELQGRLILARPLSQIARRRAPYLVREDALDGDRVLLVVDYEYLPLGFDAAAMSFGFRGRQWIGDSLSIGATWVDEARDAEDYGLAGADIVLQGGPGTYLKLEYAQTEATQSARYYSVDGGLSFAALNPLSTRAAADQRSGDAMGAEARINLRERGLTERDATLAAWWSHHDDQFAVSRRDEGFEVEKTGLEAIGALSDTFKVAFRGSRVERDGVRPGLAAQVDQVELQGTWQPTAADTISAEVQFQKQETPASPELESTVAAAEYRRRLTDSWDVFAAAQAAVDDNGVGEGYDLYTLGTRYDLSRRWTVDAEASTGDRGDGLAATLEYRLNDRHTLYGTFTQSVDRTDAPRSSLGSADGSSAAGAGSGVLDAAGSGIAVGSRWQLSDQTRVFNETQFSDSDVLSGIGHVFGLDFAPARGWRLGLSLQSGDFDAPGGQVNRDAVSASVGFANARLNWSTRLEYRDDSGITEATQYLTSNRVDFKLRDSLRLLGKLNYSETQQDVSRLNDGRLTFGQVGDAQFAEATLGLAYRPTTHDRLNWLAKVTWLYDLASYAQASSDPSADGVTSLAQSDRTDQQSIVASWEGVWRLSPRFDLGGKVARRVGEVRLGRAEGDWVESTANFAALRLSYEVVRTWDAMLEYRWLDTPDAAATRTGFLVGIDREIRKNFRLGVGYNFTDFSDDLTALDYEFQGFFVNVIGKY